MANTNTKVDLDTPSNTNIFVNHLDKNANTNINTNIDMGLAVT